MHWKRWHAHGDPTKSLASTGGETCSITNCGRPSVARGWCRMHWKRWRRDGVADRPPQRGSKPRSTAEERFWAKVDKSGGENACWLWTAYREPEWGYGVFRMKSREPMWSAHRASWTFNNGVIPVDRIVCHICDNPPCVNPGHLYLGTDQTNSTDKVLRNRTTKGRPVHHGELSFHKITLAEVREIRRRYAAGGISQSALGREFGISQTHVGHIVRGERWQHDH